MYQPLTTVHASGVVNNWVALLQTKLVVTLFKRMLVTSVESRNQWTSEWWHGSTTTQCSAHSRRRVISCKYVFVFRFSKRLPYLYYLQNSLKGTGHEQCRRLRYFGSGWTKHTKTHSQRNMRRLVVWWVAHSASKPFHFALSVLNAGGVFPFVRISICSRKSCKAFSENLSICSNFHLFASVL